MAGSVAMLLPAVLVALAGLVVLLVVTTTAVPADHLHPAVAAARRHALGAGAAAWLGGVMGAVLLSGAAGLAGSAPGLGAMLLPVGFAAGHTLAVLLGEATWPRPRGAVRAAVLARRSAAEVAPRWLHRAWWAALALLALTCAAGAATADPSGRGLSARDDAWGGTVGPYPGAPYTVPALLAVALLALIVEGGLRLVVARPSVPEADEDRRLRLASAHRLLRGATTGVLALTAGLLVVAGTAVQRLFQGAWGGETGHEEPFGHVPALVHLGTGVTVLGGLCALAAAVVLLVPAPRVRPRAVPVGAVPA